MENNLLALFALAITFIFLVFIEFQVINLKKRMMELFGKKKEGDIKKILDQYVVGVKHYFDDVEELKKFSKKLFEIGKRSIQKVGITRYNPFGDVGGDQSFSIAFLDLNDNGIVITSLFSRDGTRVYSKPIKDGKSKYYLTQEEKRSLEKAIKKEELNVYKKK